MKAKSLIAFLAAILLVTAGQLYANVLPSVQIDSVNSLQETVQKEVITASKGELVTVQDVEILTLETSTSDFETLQFFAFSSNLENVSILSDIALRTYSQYNDLNNGSRLNRLLYPFHSYW